MMMQLGGVPPATISSTNCRTAVGASWRWVMQFARKNSVPVWSVGGRKLIPGALLLAAFERAAASTEPVTTADEVSRLKAEFAASFRKLS